MLNVQQYLLNKYANADGDKLQRSIIALNDLADNYSIKYNIWEDDLVVLNYDQINSPKYDPIIKECRSLVLELGTWEIISRAFDRFFNLNEDPSQDIDITELKAHEKVDGSLITVFNYNGKWLYRTKSVIMPTDIINNNADMVTWKDRIEEGLVGFYKKALYVPVTNSYIFELTCRENRVVTKYANTEGRLTLLAIRNNERGFYMHKQYCDDIAKELLFSRPREFSFDTIDHCLDSAKALRNLEEGYVMYDDQGVPICKVKNPAYVAAHRLRGEGVLSEKRILDLIIMNELDEYLAVFPEDSELIEGYAVDFINMNIDIEDVCCFIAEFTGTQKDFALYVMDNYKGISAIAFAIKQGKTPIEAWEGLTTNKKYNMILHYTNERRQQCH